MLDLTFLGELEKLMGELYPYRYYVSGALLLAALVAGYVAYRAGAHAFLWRHRLPAVAGGAPLLVVAVLLGNYLLSPLWTRTHLEEASPLVMMAISGGVAQAAEGGQASAVLRHGMFEGADDFHFGRGDALIIRTAEGKQVLRFENFSVRNGPDLYVYLSRDTSDRRVDEALNLGRLRATDGAFNYDIPASIDTSGIRSVLVWCRQFGVLFASATLRP